MSDRERIRQKLETLTRDLDGLSDDVCTSIVNSGVLDVTITLVRQAKTLQAFGRVTIADVMGAIRRRLER